MVANVGLLPQGFSESQSERTKSFSWKAPSKDIESNGNSQIRNRNGSLSAQCHLVGSIKLLPFNFQHLSFIVCFMLPARQIAQPLCFDSCMCLVFRACSDRLGPTLSQILPFVQKEKCVLVVFCCVLTSDSCDSMKRLPAKLDPGSQLQRYSMLVSVNESVWHLQNERYHNLILFHPYLCNSVTYPLFISFPIPALAVRSLVSSLSILDGKEVGSPTGIHRWSSGNSSQITGGSCGIALLNTSPSPRGR